MKFKRIIEKEKEFTPIRVVVTIETQHELDALKTANDRLTICEITEGTREERLLWAYTLYEIYQAAADLDQDESP